MQKGSTPAVPDKDRLIDFFEKAMAFTNANRDKVILGVSGGILLLAVITGVGLYNQKASRDASIAFQNLKTDFQAVVEREGRDAALARWLADAPSVLGDLKGGASSYGAALLWYGGLAFETGEYGSASKWYGAAASEFGSDSSLRNIAWCGQGQALEQQGKQDEAASLYEKIRKSGSSVKLYEVTFHLARIKETQGDTEGAAVLYREIMESSPASSYKDLAEEKLAGL
ncbi:hypothetical protein DSLASN_35080 [Desulfoluna limicola]|uniref:Tetratricopeptide repeat-like domain-containing protein n=1 Tax=Desulfoluna limicola TaxID=2810562 RepID=A0ABM7PLB0_9BACT|nr:tetratricopeptide repeat protein [Desulfoluna limicola]BCS97876.1 hypothetical protein DSLASN_35080 [Desulfoluna limicola]